MKQTQVVLFIVVLLVGLVIRVSVLSTGPDQLIRVVPDDAFYYLETARHIAAGDGSTFDGVNPTNGYHPLWMLLMVPLVAVFKDPWWTTRLALVLGITLNVGTAVLIFRTLRRWLNVWYVPLIGAAVYFLNARSIVSSLNGLETMVSSFFFAASLYLVFSNSERHDFAFKRTVLLGLSLGLLFLSRTDNAFYIMVFWGASLMWQTRENRMKFGVITAAVAAAVASPWIIWNYFAFGGLVQSSGFAVPYVLRESFIADGHTSSELMLESLKIFLTFVGYQMYRFYLGFHFPVFLAVFIATAYLVIRKWQAMDNTEYTSSRRFVKLVAGLGVAATALIFVHTFMRWYPRTYYFDQIVILCAVGCGLGLTLLQPSLIVDRVRERIRIPSAMIISVLLFAISVPAIYSGYKLHSRGQYPHQVEFLDAARWLKQNTEPGEVMAGFNVGITSFFSERDVVNLDGAINTAAFDAIKNHRLLAYADEMNVRYIVDYDPVMFEMYRHFLGAPSHELSRLVIADIDRPDVDWIDSHIRVFDFGKKPDLAFEHKGD